MKHFILLGIALSIISCGRISNTQQLQRMYGKEIDLSVLSRQAEILSTPKIVVQTLTFADSIDLIGAFAVKVEDNIGIKSCRSHVEQIDGILKERGDKYAVLMEFR